MWGGLVFFEYLKRAAATCWPRVPRHRRGMREGADYSPVRTRFDAWRLARRRVVEEKKKTRFPLNRHAGPAGGGCQAQMPNRQPVIGVFGLLRAAEDDQHLVGGRSNRTFWDVPHFNLEQGIHTVERDRPTVHQVYRPTPQRSITVEHGIRHPPAPVGRKPAIVPIGGPIRKS